MTLRFCLIFTMITRINLLLLFCKYLRSLAGLLSPSCVFPSSESLVCSVVGHVGLMIALAKGILNRFMYIFNMFFQAMLPYILPYLNYEFHRHHGYLCPFHSQQFYPVHHSQKEPPLFPPETSYLPPR